MTLRMRMRFRETLWFKKGHLDEAAADTAADAGEADVPAATIDTLPVEDRYVDDGSLRSSDSQLFGLHTGQTQALGFIEPVPSAGVPEQVLIAELKTGRRVYLAMIAAALALVFAGSAALVV
jgi:hypothetical protein